LRYPSYPGFDCNDPCCLEIETWHLNHRNDEYKMDQAPTPILHFDDSRLNSSTTC
jgi:hypothetical protein